MSGGAGGAVRAGAAYEAVLVDKVTNRVDNIIDALDRLQDAFRQTAQGAAPLTVSVNATGAGMRKLSQNVQSTGDKFKAFARKLRVAQTQVNSFGQAMGQAAIHVGNAMMRMGRRFTVASLGIGAFIATSISEADRHRQVVASLEESWGEGTQGALAFAEDYARRMRRNVTDVIEGLLQLRGVISGLDKAGKSAEEIDELAKSLYALGIDFASFGKGMSDEEGILKIIQALGGEAQELKRFGINVMQKDLEEYAKTQGLVFSQLSNAAQMMLRIELLQKQMQEKGRTGAAFRERFGFQAMTKAALAAFKTFQKQVGEELEQFGITVAKVVSKALAALTQIKDVGKKVLGSMVALGAAGVLLTGFGFALVGFGILFLATTSLITSAMAVVSAIITAGVGAATVALLPIVGALAGIAMVVSALAAPFVLAAISAINFKSAIAGIAGTMGEILAVFGRATTLAVYFGSKGDWDRTFEAITIAGRIAFIKLGDSIKTIIKKALFEGMMGAMKLAARVQNEVLKGLTQGGPIGAWVGLMRGLGEGAAGGLFDALQTGQPGEIAFLERRLGQLEALMNLGTQTPDEGGGPGGSGSGGSGSGGGRFPGAADSVGGFGASFALNTGLFRPQISAQERGNQIAQEQLSEQKKTNTILTSRPPTELVMQ